MTLKLKNSTSWLGEKWRKLYYVFENEGYDEQNQSEGNDDQNQNMDQN